MAITAPPETTTTTATLLLCIPSVQEGLKAGVVTVKTTTPLPPTMNNKRRRIHHSFLHTATATAPAMTSTNWTRRSSSPPPRRFTGIVYLVSLLLVLFPGLPEPCLAERRGGGILGGGGGGASRDNLSFHQHRAATLMSSRSSSSQKTQQPSTTTNKPLSSTTNREEPLLKSFLRAKCGPTGAAVWAYQGRLVDPLNGITIANVQGVELVRCLAVTDPSGAQRERFKRRAGDLAIASTLSSAALSPNLEYAGTILSRKLFCYTSPHIEESNQRLLRKVRLRPTSPERTIPVNQAATVYDTATTYCQVSTPTTQQQRQRQPPSSSTSNTLWALHTEYSDGRSLWTTTNVQDDELQKLVEFTVYARPQPLWKQRVDWRRWLGNNAAASTTEPTSGSVLSPKRSALVQIGGSSGADAVGKFGARETYQYNTAFGRCQCRYSRYGEGPAWYGPGRICTLELQGRRVEAWSDLPAQIAQLVHERVVGFLSVNAPIPQDDVLASRAVQGFRGKGAAQLQIAPIDRDGTGGATSGPFLRSWNRALSAWDRVRSATSVTLGGERGGGRGNDNDDSDENGRNQRRRGGGGSASRRRR